MSTTVKRITISLTKEQQRQLTALQAKLGENQSQVIHRAVAVLYEVHEIDSYATHESQRILKTCNKELPGV